MRLKYGAYRRYWTRVRHKGRERRLRGDCEYRAGVVGLRDGAIHRVHVRRRRQRSGHENSYLAWQPALLCLSGHDGIPASKSLEGEREEELPAHLRLGEERGLPTLVCRGGCSMPAHGTGGIRAVGASSRVGFVREFVLIYYYGKRQRQSCTHCSDAACPDALLRRVSKFRFFGMVPWNLWDVRLHILASIFCGGSAIRYG